MSNLFFYNRVEPTKDEAGTDIEVTFRDCINVNKVLRVIQMKPNGQDVLVVIMDDGREEKMELVRAVKGKPEAYTERKFIQTEIPIFGADIQRFFETYDK